MLMPYLSFNGNCEEAMKYYSNIFEGKEPNIVKYGNNVDGNKKYQFIGPNKVMHGYVELTETGGISGADVEQKVEIGSAINLNILLSPVEKAKEAFEKLSEEGLVVGDFKNNLPPHEKSASGAVKDKYGFTWIIAGHE